MKKIKIITTTLYLFTAVEILGAWNNTSQVQETAAFSEVSIMQCVEEENRLEAQELLAREEYAKMKMTEWEKNNEYRMLENRMEEEQHDLELAREKKRKERERKRKEREKKKQKEEQAILERIVEAEAGDQDLKGRILVANVIMNRVKSGHFPDSVKGVVFAHRQFSPISNGSYYRVSVSDKTKKAVKKALDGVDYSQGALYFMCRRASSPSNVAWFDRALKKVKEYGCHEFFK